MEVIIKVTGKLTTKKEFNPMGRPFGNNKAGMLNDYSWAGKVNCDADSTPSASGSGDFEQEILQNDTVKIGDIPPNINNLYITLTSDEDAGYSII